MSHKAQPTAADLQKVLDDELGALGMHITEHTFGRWTQSSDFEVARTQHAHTGV